MFAVVFPKPAYTTPTQEATPDLGDIPFGQPFGGFNLPADIVHESVRLAQAWSVATRYLTLQPSLEQAPKSEHDLVSAREALILLFGAGSKTQELGDWYLHEVVSHLRAFVIPNLQLQNRPGSPTDAIVRIKSTVQALRAAQHAYLSPLQDVQARLPRAAADRTFAGQLEAFAFALKLRYHALALHSLSKSIPRETLTSAFYYQLKDSLEDHSNPEACLKDGRCHCRVVADGPLLEALHEVGLGGGASERAFAHAVHKLLAGSAVERRCFEVDWSGQSSVVPKLREWMQSKLSLAVQEALAALTNNHTFTFSQNDVLRLSNTAVLHLGRQRTHALFDYVQTWPESKGAVLNIKDYLASNIGEKAFLCNSFMDQMQHRILHAGADTTEILSIYVNIIHVFKLLDARGVLLEKVAMPIRNYLRARDDTVNIIAASFLAELDEIGEPVDDENDQVCVDIALEVEKSTLEDAGDSRIHDWDNMEWVPEPIDAGPTYNASKAEDVVTYILGLFEEKEFLKEVTNVLAQHLLQSDDGEYAKETRLVELFKSRFDAAKLQPAEVMLKDMRDSLNIERKIFRLRRERTPQTAAIPPTPRDVQAAIPAEGITLNSLYKLFDDRMQRPQFLAVVKLVASRRNDLFYPKRGRLPREECPEDIKPKFSKIDFRLQIVSGFFWPQMRTNDFEMPSHYAERRVKTEHLFSTMARQRKLHWKPAVTRVSLELELQDRKIVEKDIPAWRASVIDMFASERPVGAFPDHEAVYDDSTGFTVTQVMETLSMEEELLVDAFTYWTGKRVLYERSPGTYAVLERLDMNVGAAHQQAQPQTETISTIKSQDAMFQENATMFETFIANMLRNSGPKEVGGMMGITNMLKMVLPAFTYGEEEVRWLLAEMEGRGEVRRNGESYAIE